MTGGKLGVRAAVSDGHGSTQVRRLEPGGAGGWLRVESSAVCGTDVQLHAAGLTAPTVLGHHVVGRVETIQDELATRLGVQAGDRVAVEEYLGCGRCQDCSMGRYRLCPEVSLWGDGQRVGMLPVAQGCGLHGGNAELLALDARHRCHRVPAEISTDHAAWTLSLANAVDWTLRVGGAGPGDRVLVIGPGYHGLACVAAAQVGGATDVTVLGLPTDRARLGYARAMGARAVEGSLPDDLCDHFDVVIDTAGAAGTPATGVQALRREGRLVLAGLGDPEAVLEGTDLVKKLLSVRGVRGREASSVTEALRILASGRHTLTHIPTSTVGLNDIGEVLSAMRSGQGPDSPHVVVRPAASSPDTGAAHHHPHLQEAPS